MPKNDLIGGALWEQYSAKVGERMNNPRHRGEITEEEAKAMGARLIVADWGAEAFGVRRPRSADLGVEALSWLN